MSQKFHFAILRIQVTRASRGFSAIAELLVNDVVVGLRSLTTTAEFLISLGPLLLLTLHVPTVRPMLSDVVCLSACLSCPVLS